METSNATNLSNGHSGPTPIVQTMQTTGTLDDTTYKPRYDMEVLLRSDPIRDTAYERVFNNSYWKFLRISGQRNGITFATANPVKRTQLPAAASPATSLTSLMSQITLSYHKEGTTRRAITQFAARTSLSIVSLFDHTILRTRLPVTTLPRWAQYYYLRYNKQHLASFGPLWPPSVTQNTQIGIATAVHGNSPCYGWGISQGPIKYWSEAAKLLDGHQPQQTPIVPLAALYAALRCLQLALTPNTWPQSPVCTGLNILFLNATYIAMIQSLFESAWYSPARRRRNTNVWETQHQCLGETHLASTSTS
jgi:hypothetical protein